MAHVRAIAVLILLGTTPAAAESVTVEVTPRADLRLEIRAEDEATSGALGAALGKSLGCTLTDVRNEARGNAWVYRALCSGVFKRHGQVVEGQLKFAGFRQALLKASVDEINVDVGV